MKKSSKINNNKINNISDIIYSCINQIDDYIDENPVDLVHESYRLRMVDQMRLIANNYLLFLEYFDSSKKISITKKS